MGNNMEYNKFKGFRGGAPAPANSPSQSSTTVEPWAPMQPYITGGYELAANQYAQGPAQYTPFSQAATLTPDQQAAINGTSDYVNSAGTQQMLNTQSNTVQGLMDGSTNPYGQITGQTNPMLAGYMTNNNLNDVSGGLNRFMYENTGDPGLQHSISNGMEQVNAALGGASGLLQNGSGFGRTIASNIANQGKSDAGNKALGLGFDNQNTNRLSAIQIANGINNNKANLAGGLLTNQGSYDNNASNLGFSQYANALQMPLGLLSQLNDAGGLNQTQAQTQIADAVNRWNFAQQSPYDALAKYAAAINPNKAWGNTYIDNSGSSQAGGTNIPALAVGAGTTLAGLGASINNGK
jgi:hypothetical protein